MASGGISWWHSIGRRLIFYIFLFSSLVTLFSTGFQLYFEYRRDLQGIAASLHQIERSYLNSLSEGLWSFNERMLQVQLLGILDLPEMRYLEIRRLEGPPLVAGEPAVGRVIEQEFPLTYRHRNQEIVLGTLLVVAGLDQVYARLRDRVLVILATQAVKTFFVSSFIFILFYFMVGRHLTVLADYARSLNLARLGRPLSLPGRPPGAARRDELAMVVRALNEMGQALQREVAERERIGEQLRRAQKMEAVGTLAGGIAHDFNNLLTPIIGYCELAQISMSRAELEKWHVDEVLQAALMARELVGRILTFSRIGINDRRRLALQPIIKEELERLQRSGQAAKLEVKLDLDPECGPIEADPEQVRQLLINLCTNAVQAMEADGGILQVRLARASLESAPAGATEPLAPGDYALLTVSDNGPGMDAATRERVFEPYFSTREKGRGTGLGLGLALVHGIVKDQGGLVVVQSEPGQGSCFLVYLPLARPLVTA